MTAHSPGLRTVLLATALAACGPLRSTSRTASSARAATEPIAPDAPLWVVAPHPDDEVLMAAGLIARARASGRAVTVLVLTNGDLGCGRNGHARQGETVASLAALGVPESSVRFLGYPDGHLSVLGEVPLPPLARARPDGTCGEATGTYASRGAGHTDVHSALHGAPGAYTAASLEDDLASLLARERPGEIVLPHPRDDHPDHAMTYVFVRRALERARLAHAPRLLRSFVHVGPCWPNGSHAQGPCPAPHAEHIAPLPSLPGALEAYGRTALRLAYPAGARPKLELIARYASQLDGPVERDWLGAFARADEAFFVETLALVSHREAQLERVDAPGAGHQRFAFVLAPAGEIATATRVELIGREGTAYELVFASDGASLELRRDGALLRGYRLPRPATSDAGNAWEVRIARRPDEASVAEVTLRRDGALVGVWIDPAPRDVGEVRTPATARVVDGG